MPTAKAVSPASIPAPPMAHTAPQTMGSGRRTRSEIAVTGFTQVPGAGTVIAASPDGTIWVLGTTGLASGDKYIYHYANGSWTNIPGAATRIAVGPDGMPWVVNAAGGIYRYNGSYFTGLAGGASDISVGPDGSVYIISNQDSGSQYGRAIFHYVNGTWTQLPGAAVRIAASWDTGSYPGITPGGVYVINGVNSIYYYNTAYGFRQIPGAASDLAPTMKGGLFVLGTPPSSSGEAVYYNNLATGSWSAQQFSGLSISTDTANLYVIAPDFSIYRLFVRPVVTDLALGIYVTDRYNNQVVEYAPGQTGTFAPVATISGSSTCMSYPNGVALDSQNRIYVANEAGCPAGHGGAGTIAVFPADSNGNVAPTSVISVNGWWGPEAVAVDASGNIYEGQAQNAPNNGYKLAAGSNGVVTPLATYAGTCGGCQFAPIVLTPNGQLAIHDSGFSFYSTSQTGAVGVTSSFNSSQIPFVGGAAIDQNGNLAVSTSASGPGGTYGAMPAAVQTYATNATGTNAAPISSLSGSNTGFISPRAIGFDESGHLYVVNANGDFSACSILVFAAGASGNVAPITSWSSVCGTSMAILHRATR